MSALSRTSSTSGSIGERRRDVVLDALWLESSLGLEVGRQEVTINIGAGILAIGGFEVGVYRTAAFKSPRSIFWIHQRQR